MPLPRSYWISLVAMFTAVAVVLNFAVAIPAPYATFLFYEVWEVPVVVALLILGYAGGACVAALNAMVLEVVRPGALPTGPLYNLIAELAMFAGIGAALWLGSRFSWQGTVTAAGATATAAATRTAVMTVVNAIALPMQPPIGFGLPWSAIPAYLVYIGIFNATVTLYTVPAAFAVKNAVRARLKTLRPLN